MTINAIMPALIVLESVILCVVVVRMQILLPLQTAFFPQQYKSPQQVPTLQYVVYPVELRHTACASAVINSKATVKIICVNLLFFSLIYLYVENRKKYLVFIIYIYILQIILAMTGGGVN
jgi:hypothetical protein